MWADFQAGELDCSQAPADQVQTITDGSEVKDGTWTARSWPAAALYFVGMNMTDPTLGPSLDLRKAISQSADAQAVVDGVSPGVAEVAGGYVPAGIPGYKAAQNPYPYNLESATSLVTALGAVPTLDYWYDTSEDHRQIADALVTSWAQAGLTVEASDYEWGTFLDKLSRGDEGSGSQLFRVSWIADYPAMDAFLYPLFQSDQSPTGSYTFYSNQGVDELLQKARATTDAQQRHNLYAQAEKLILGRHAGGAPVLLPVLPRRRGPGARVHRRPDGHHRHADGLGRVDGPVCSRLHSGVKLTSRRWERHSAHQGKGRCVTRGCPDRSSTRGVAVVRDSGGSLALSVIKEVTVKKPVRRWRGLLIVAAVLIVAAMLLAACGSSDTSSSSSPTAGGEPKAGGTYNFPLGAEPISIEPLNTQESEGWHVNHQVFQSLYCLQIQPDGTTTKAVPDLAEKTEVNADATVFTFTIKQGVMFQAPVSREVTAQDFVDSWNYNADPKNKSATTYIIAPIKGINPDTGYSEGPELSGLKVIDKYTLRGDAAVPVRRLPGDAGAPHHPGLPGGLRQGDRPQGVLRQAGRHRPVHGRQLEAQPVDHPGQEPRLLEHQQLGQLGHPGLRRHHQHADLHGREHRVAGLPEGHARLLLAPDRQLQGRPERPEDPGRHLDGQGLPEHVRLLHQRGDEQADARRRRQPADPRRSQLRGRSRGRQQHRQRGHLDPVRLDRAGHHPRLRRGDRTRTRTIPPRRSRSSTSSPARSRRRSRTGSTPAPATTRSPRRSSTAGPRPCRR